VRCCAGPSRLCERRRRRHQRASRQWTKRPAGAGRADEPQHADRDEGRKTTRRPNILSGSRSRLPAHRDGLVRRHPPRTARDRPQTIRIRSLQRGTNNRSQGGKSCCGISVRLAFVIASVIALPAFAMADDTDHARQYLVTLAAATTATRRDTSSGIPTCHAFSAARTWASRFRVKVSLWAKHHNRQKTGIGSWTREQIVKAIQVGERPDGRILAADHALARFCDTHSG